MNSNAHGIHWAAWKLLPSVELWQAVLLSLGVEPTSDLEQSATSNEQSVKDAHAWRRARGYDQLAALPAEHWKRMRFCRQALSTEGPIRPQGSLYRGMLQDPRCKVLLGDVADFLSSAGFSLPAEMPRKSTEPVDARASPGSGIDVVGEPSTAPHFITSARPMEVPPELLALQADVRITYEDNIWRQRGRGACRAGDYRAEIEATIARQAQGYFTLNEAAQVLADSRPELDPAKTVERFRLAHSKGALPIHQGVSRFPLEVGETIRDFWDLLEATELDAWLRVSAGYGFPPAAGLDTKETSKRIDDARNNRQPLQRFPAQESRVLAVIASLQHDPKRLPPRQSGRRWVKAEVWDAIGVCTLFSSEKVFDKAWERLRQRGDIAERPGL